MKKLLTILIALTLFVIVIKKKTFEDFEKNNLIAYNNEIWPPNEEYICYNNIPPNIKNKQFEKELDELFEKEDLIKKKELIKKEKTNKHKKKEENSKKKKK